MGGMLPFSKNQVVFVSVIQFIFKLFFKYLKKYQINGFYVFFNDFNELKIKIKKYYFNIYLIKKYF